MKINIITADSTPTSNCDCRTKKFTVVTATVISSTEADAAAVTLAALLLDWINFSRNLLQSQIVQQKSRIRETKHLSTGADSSTDAIGGWTKNI